MEWSICRGSRRIEGEEDEKVPPERFEDDVEGALERWKNEAEDRHAKAEGDRHGAFLSPASQRNRKSTPCWFHLVVKKSSYLSRHSPNCTMFCNYS